MLVGNRARIRQDAMSLNPIDDALFQKMAEDTGFCQEILQVVLNDKALQVMDNVRVCQELCVKKFSRLHHSAS